MTKHLLSFFLVFSISVTVVLADAGIFQTYAIVNFGLGDMYLAGGENADGAIGFNGTGYGTPASLTLNGGEIKSYKNGGSDVTGAFIHYRVYKQTDPAPAFTELNLPFADDLGNGDQKWAQTNAGVDILALATAGNGDYFLEVYWRITTNGNDIFDSDNGANYKAPFTVNILPVDLTSFTANANKNTVDLNWQTAQEINNDFFQIERRTDQSQNWKVIGKEQGEGNSETTVYYTFTDTKPANGINYYRLKQTDFDGQFEYSEMVRAEIRNTILIDIFPNPTASNLTVVAPNNFTRGQIRLFDAMGRMVLSSSINERNYLNLSDLNSGIYFFRLLDENGNVVAEDKVRKL